MTKYHTIIGSRIVKLVDEPPYNERATIIRIDDEGGGPFVVIEQHPDEGDMKIAIDPGEWPFIRDAVEEFFRE